MVTGSRTITCADTTGEKLPTRLTTAYQEAGCHLHAYSLDNFSVAGKFEQKTGCMGCMELALVNGYRNIWMWAKSSLAAG